MSENVKVVVRLRPYIYDYEEQDGAERCVRVSDDRKEVAVKNPVNANVTTFSFDECLNSFVNESDPNHASKVW
jgi:hypothetical protein